MWGQMTLPGAPSYWGSPARPHLSMALPGVMGLRVTPAKLRVNTPHRGLSRPPPLRVISPGSVGAHTLGERQRWMGGEMPKRTQIYIKVWEQH